MNPSIEEINKVRALAGRAPLTTLGQTSTSTQPKSLRDSLGLTPAPQEQPKEQSLSEKLGSRFSKLGQGISDVANSYTTTTPGQDSGTQGLIGLTKIGGAIGGGISDVGEAITKPITDLAGSAITKGREIQKANDTQAIAQGRLSPENALSNKPYIENQIGEAIAPVAKSASEEYKTLSPNTQEVLGNLGDMTSGAMTLTGADALLKSGVGKAVTETLGKTGSKLGDVIATHYDAKAREGISKEIGNILNSKKSLINQTKLAETKGVNFNEQLSDPEVFKGLKPDNGKINPDEAIATVQDRIDKAMDIKSKTLPELDRFIPTTPKQELRDLAVADIKGKYTPADEKDIISRIDKQISALPEELKISDIDNYRAVFRKSSRDAKGILKDDSEYAALENAFRNKVFDTTDKLSFEGSKYKELNDYIRQNIETKTFLDKTLRGQILPGGKLGNYAARGIGALAGSAGGVLGTLAGAEGGGMIANIIMNNKLGNSLKMKMIRELTTDQDIIEEAGKLLQGAKDYQIPQLPAKGTISGPTIKVAPEAPVGQFETTGKTPIVTPQLEKPNMSLQNTANSTTPIVSNIADTLPQTPKSGKMSGFAQLTKESVHPEDADSINDFITMINGETKVPQSTADAIRKEVVAIADNYGIPLGKTDRQFADNLAKRLAKDFPMDSSIPKELLPLAEEAKKYKSAEEFMQKVKGGGTQYGDYTPGMRANIPAGYKNITEMGIDPDEMVTVYRGIDDLAGKIKKKKINDGDFVTTDFDSALSYTGDPKNVVEMQVPAKTLYNSEPRDFIDEPFYTGSEYIYTAKNAKPLPTDKQLIDLYNKVNGKKLPGFADLGILPKAAIGTAVATGALKAYSSSKNSTKK